MIIDKNILVLKTKEKDVFLVCCENTVKRHRLDLINQQWMMLLNPIA